MLERAVAVLLAISLSVGYARDAGSWPPVKDQLAGIPIAASVEVRLRHAPKVRGTLWSKDDQGLTLKIGSGADIKERRFAFDEIRSIKIVTASRTPAAAWIALGVVVTLGVIVAIIYAKFRANS